MSWFDAANFTSYAKTALASAQKSIDKVLDIDDGSTGSSSDAAASKGKGNEVEKSSTFKTSTPKAAALLPKHSLSKEKQPALNDSFEDNSGDFWSSFLGTSDSSSKNKKTVKKSSKSNEPLGYKKSESILTSGKQKRKPRNTNTEHEIKKDFYSDNGNSISVEKTQDNVNKNDRKSRSTKSEQVIGGDAKASSKQSEQQSYIEPSICSDYNEAESKNVISDVVTKDNSFGDVCLEQNPNGVENRDKPEITIYSNTEKINVNEVTTQQEMGKENKPGVIDIDIEDNDSESMTLAGLVNDTDQSLLPIVRSKLPTNMASSLTTEMLKTSEQRNEEIAVQNSGVINEIVRLENSNTRKAAEGLLTYNGAEASSASNEITGLPSNGTRNVGEGLPTNEELMASDTSNEEERLLTSNTSHLNEELIDSNTRNIEEASNFEESTANQFNDSEQQARKKPSEDDCGIEIVKGILFKAEDVLQEESNTSCDHQSLTSKENSKPVEDAGALGRDIKELSVKLPNEKSSCDLKKQEFTKSGNQSTIEVQHLMKEISDLKELVNARESKMVSLSKENIDYQETNAILRSQIEQLETINAGENEEFEELKEEFTTRITDAEVEYHKAANQRDQLRTELEETTVRLTDISNRQKEEYTTLIAEKDEQIAQLIAEGEKLSKQELQSNTVIKKLRVKEKENDAFINKQTNKIQEYEEEVKRLTDILTSRDDSNSKQGDAIIKLNAYVKKQEEQLSKQASDLEDSNEKLRSMQAALDNAYKEMTALQLQTATADSTIQEAVLSTEMKAKEELRMALEKSRHDFQQESEMMALQVADLQSSLTRAEQQSIRREENLRQEVKHVQQRLQEAEDRNQELATSVSHATRPLLRQIENLQTTHNGQAFTWEKVEKNLTERLNEAQNQLLRAQEKEHIATQSVSELNARISRLESQLNTYRAERSRIEADLELERTKTGTLEDKQSRESAKYEAMVKKYQKLIEDANLDKEHLEQQLTVERSKMDTELMKLKTALEEKEKLLSHHSSFTGIRPSPIPANGESSNQHELDTTVTRHPITSRSSSSVMEGITKGIMGGTTALVERLQAQVRQKDGEIELLQDAVTSLRQSRDSVMEELTSLTEKLERLEISHEKYKDLKEKHDALQQRYNAVLQMYGEKEEEAEELRMDLQDVKSMYKQQLEQLFSSTR